MAYIWIYFKRRSNDELEFLLSKVTQERVSDCVLIHAFKVSLKVGLEDVMEVAKPLWNGRVGLALSLGPLNPLGPIRYN